MNFSFWDFLGIETGYVGLLNLWQFDF
jgi:hypothetical protein